jgi:glycosyltransferase involved in cell wall biosynthesis
LKILLISSVIPQDTTATELVLYRHFAAARDELKVTIASDHPALGNHPDGIPIIPNPVLLRLTKTRLAAIAHSLRQLLPTHDTRTLYHYLCQHRPDAILTVAHGTLYPLALRVARQLQIPLISIFHDWFPDMAWVPNLLRPYLNHQFLQLYRQSDLAFCVSEGMRQALGDHPNAQVLLPIPGDKPCHIEDSCATEQRDIHASFTVVYAGTLSTCYAPMLQALGKLAKTMTSIRLRFFGPTPHWSPEILHDLTKAGIYGGFLSRAELLRELHDADALLIVMSFDAGDRRRTKTSFPSKLVEYVQFGKPVVVWGPEYSSAVKWAKQNQSAITVTNPSPHDLVSTLAEVSKKTDRYNFYAQQAQKMAFHPNVIQAQFMSSLIQTIDKPNLDAVEKALDSIS